MKHITERERYFIELWYKEGRSVSYIAEQLGKNRSTIYRELKRGCVELLNNDWSYRTEYIADKAQRDYKANKKKSGRKCKLAPEDDFLLHVKYMIQEMKYSPEAVLYTLEERKVCIKTLYNYIHKNYINGLTVYSLPYAKPKKKAKNKAGKRIYKNGGKSIEERPRYILDRKEFGHWEMDTVYSSKDDKTCLLVLSERMARKELVFKIKDRTANSVVRALNRYERKIGAPAFRNTFKTITCDNGVEFSDILGIEKSCLTKGNRTTVYFCHPYCSGERGTNENINRMIRRWIPKGDDIGLYTPAEIQYINDWINNYPRGIFGGLSSNQYINSMGVAN